MGLRLSRTIGGFTADYWRITQTFVNVEANTVAVTLSLYKSKTDYQAGVTPLAKDGWVFIGATDPTNTNAIMDAFHGKAGSPDLEKAITNAMQTLPGWTTAVQQ